jgi:hypothetical protein
MTQRQTKYFTVWDGTPDGYAFEGFLEELTKAMDTIPEEYREHATVGVSDSGWMEIQYTRPETDLEIQTRIAEHEARQAQAEANELATYQRLKAKYEP